MKTRYGWDRPEYLSLHIMLIQYPLSTKKTHTANSPILIEEACETTTINANTNLNAPGPKCLNDMLSK